MKKTVQKSFSHIRAAYRRLLNKPKMIRGGTTAEWLLDNYYVFAEEYGALRHLKTPRRDKSVAREMLSFADAYLLNEEYKISEDTLFAALSLHATTLSSSSLRYLSPALSVCLFSAAARICEKPTEQGLLGNVIRSLFVLRDLDMKKLYNQHCGVDIALSDDNAFPKMTAKSKDLYRRAAERLAAECGKTDTFVAEKSVSLAKGKKGAAASAGFYLIGDGQAELRKALSVSTRRKTNRARLYVGSVCLISLLGAASVYIASERLLWAILSLFPVADITAQLLSYCLLKTTPVRELPRLALDEGIPENIAVIYPALLSSPKKAEEMAEKLEICYLANREENLFFGILGDFKDSTAPHEDPAIPQALESAVLRLNETYGNRFFVLIRNQTFAPRQGKWMGRERKRGAITDFNLFLRNRYAFRYSYGCADLLPGTKHVITLDDDTLLPPGAARLLAGNALHPLAKPEIRDGKVVSGYGIIQPRISLRLESVGRTLFSRIFAGHGGTDPYQSSVSEFYMDVFGETVFTGKGIYHVDSFLRCLSFPEDAVLSHDLLEGSFVRCGLASDVQVFDAFPARLSDYSLRQNRWIRGDWQTLPWLFSKVPEQKDKKVKNRLSLLSRWKIFDNLRRSLTPFFALSLLCGGNAVGALVAFLFLSMPLFLTVIDGLLGKTFSPFEKRWANIFGGTLAALYRTTFSVVFLADSAFSSLLSAIKGFVRVFTRKHTLEWVTASEAEAAKSQTFVSSFSRMLPSVLTGLFLLFACLSGMFPLGGLQLFLAVLFILAPPLSYMISFEHAQDTYSLPPKGEKLLRETGERIWQFFKNHMTEEDHFLPPDNLQIRPYRGVAHRTSPTNIGFGFLAPICARELGLIEKDEAEAYISRLMDTVERLPTRHGHLYNWYDTKTLSPLSPRYVSTVDSGNFVSYLLTAAMALKSYANGETPLVKRMQKFAESTDFVPLYNEKKKLFSIGFSAEENRLTDSYYDLLISEARQTGFLAIALGQIPPAHWFTLSRGLVAADGYRGLVSWSGTMFEYFMPLLIMRKYENSLLAETYRFAISCQKRTGRRRRIPWGVSESGFYAFDNDGNYQYKAFGISELGLSRQTEGEIVIAPYATLLALTEDPKGALSNMERMRQEGLYGEYGFFEAADYTPERLSGNMRRGVVKSYMAHHQGMSLAAIANLLCDNVLQRHFHAYPPVRAAEPLLKEQVPIGAPVLKDRHARTTPVRQRWQTSVRSIRTFTREDTAPCPVQLLSNGSYHAFIDTHGRGQSTFCDVAFNSFSPLEGGGQSIRILNPVTGEVIDGYGSSCTFSENRAEFSGENGSLSFRLSVSCAGEDSFEVRRLVLENRSGREKTYEVFYYAEPILSVPAAHDAHPAFSRLFLTTEEKNGVLFAHRRKRSPEEKTFTGFATGFCEGDDSASIQFDTDRLSFFGRSASLPKSVCPGQIPAGKTGTVLDPCFAIKLRITVPANESGSIVFLSGLCEVREAAFRMIGKYKSGLPLPEENSFLFKEGEESHFLHAAAFLFFGGAMDPALQNARRENKRPKEDLWKLGISGDFPIVLLRLCALSDEPLLDEAVKAHAYWQSRGKRTDLVIFCDEPAGYTRPVFQMAEKRKNAGIYILGRRELEKGDVTLLSAAATLYLDTARGGFDALPPYAPLPKATTPLPNTSEGTLRPLSLLYDNGIGGFDSLTGDYVINQHHAGETPLPWSHIVANETFGFISDADGAGNTFSGNSQSFRLSPWFCDPVKAPLSEWLTLSEGKDVWSPMAGAFPENGNYRVRYGLSFVSYERETRGLYHKATLFVPQKGKTKYILLDLENKQNAERPIAVRYSFIPVLGTLFQKDRILISENEDVLCVQDALSNKENTVYLRAEKDGKYGQNGNRVYAETTKVLPPHTSCQFLFTLGTDSTVSMDASALLKETVSHSEALFSGLSVETGDAATDLMLNRWLPYQAMICRLFARSAYYQSGGAFGFRDQLQDTLALLDTAPSLSRRQILLHAAHQFEEGDAFHWWHPDGRGVRTRFSDDRLFLPYIACIYATETGDETIWDAEESFVKEPPLAPGEEERYTFIKGRTEPFPLYEHAVRAIDISLRKGEHGLPLMGGGDWNDGMNRVGIGGKGESVWLAWFLKVTLDLMIPVCEKRGDKDRAARYRKESLCFLEAAENTFHGTQYARAFFDDGTPLGTEGAQECSIDAISQAWAVIAGARRSHAKSAMESVSRNLISKEKGLIKLLAPPFDSAIPDPGYIRSYPKGLRENGGQYTHGAIWAIIAFCLLGEKETAWSLFKMLNPISHSETQGEALTYKTEPYVLSADVYTAPGHEGRGGWSWYTGAAAWMYRLGIRYILGFQRKGDTVSFSPSMPLSEKGYTLRYRFGKSQYIFHVHGESDEIKLIDDGETHEFTIPSESS